MKVTTALMTVAIIAVALAAVTTSLVTSTFAAAPKNGWGLVTSQEATSEHDVGQHASDPVPSNPGHDTPRSGIGNVANTFTGTKNPSELGCLLASIDTSPATGC